MDSPRFSSRATASTTKGRRADRPRRQPRARRSDDHSRQHASVTAGELLALEVRSSASGKTRRTVAPTASVECSATVSNDIAREFVRSMGDRMPIYSHPFVGCKVLNLILTSSAISWTGTVYQPMITIAQGVADNQRTGDVIRVIGVDVNLRSSIGTAAAPASNSEYQVQLCYSPLQSLAITSVYQDVGTAYSGSSPEDWDYRAVVKRYARVHSFVDQYHPMRIHTLRVRCNEVTNYDQGGTTLTYGVWGLACISGEDPAAPTQVPLLYGTMQMYYQDV